jgi:hypothetical protein
VVVGSMLAGFIGFNLRRVLPAAIDHPQVGEATG